MGIVSPLLSKRGPVVSWYPTSPTLLVGIKVRRYLEGSKNWYDHLIRTALGKDAVSTKDPEEREWTTTKTTIGHLLDLNGVPDVTGNKLFYSPTAERQAKTSRVTWQECFDSDKRSLLTAGRCTEALHTWLWQGIVCPLLRPFIACFKRPLEGRLIGRQDELVSPIRAGEGPEAEEEFQSDIAFLRATSRYWDRNPDLFRVPLYHLLDKHEQLDQCGCLFQVAALWVLEALTLLVENISYFLFPQKLRRR